MPTSTANCACIILAAGNGTRMRSHIPKVLHEIGREPLLNHVLRAAQALSPQQMVVVVAPGMEAVRAVASKAYPSCQFAVQDKQLGTGHAVMAAMETLKSFAGDVLILYGDTPLLTASVLMELMQAKREAKATGALLGMQPEDPTGYGRLVMQEQDVVRIVECKDATPEQKRIGWVWGGIMAFDAAFLRAELAVLKPSPVTGEFYLTSIIEKAAGQGLRTRMVPVSVEEVMGVNSRSQLAEAEAALQRRLRLKAMDAGTTLIDPATTYFCADTQLGRDVVVHPCVVFGPGVIVGDNVEIRAFSHIEGTRIANQCIIGPYARLRPGAVLEEHAHIGNFVEVKASTIGAGAKVNHLTYIGDAQIGASANIGAGTITCNYDGVKKHKTIIGERAFIGSNTALVAPVMVGAGAVVGAGSVITEDVPGDALAIARGKQVVKRERNKHSS